MLNLVLIIVLILILVWGFYKPKCKCVNSENMFNYRVHDGEILE